MAAALSLFARDVAPHVDRLAIAVHRHAAPAGRELLRAFGLPNAGVLIDASPLLLAGPMPAAQLALLERYVPPARLQDTLDAHVRQGLLAQDVSSAYTLTPSGRALLASLTAAQARTISWLWSGHAAELPALVALTARAIGAGTRPPDRSGASTLPPDRYPAFRLLVDLPAPPDPSPAAALLRQLTSLRYLRADAHAAAWLAHDLDAAQAVALTRLWQADPTSVPADAIEPLHQRGLVQRADDRWQLTPAGQAEREAIESETNANAAPVWQALQPNERAHLLAGLSALPA